MMPDDVSMPEDEISPPLEERGIVSPMHGLQSEQGRWFVPSHTPPLAEKSNEVFAAAGNLSPGGKVGCSGDASAEAAGEFERFCPSGALGGTDVETWEVAGKSLVEIGPLLCDVFDGVLRICEIKHSKFKNSGGIFPLPETPQGLSHNNVDIADQHVPCVLAVCRALNSYYGICRDELSPPTLARKSSLMRLCTYA